MQIKVDERALDSFGMDSGIRGCAAGESCLAGAWPGQHASLRVSMD